MFDILIVPTELTPDNTYRAKYTDLANRTYFMRHGCDTWGFAKMWVDEPNRTTLINQPDVLLIPKPYSDAIGGRRNAVENRLEQLHVPADWITPATTWREIIRAGLRSCFIMQRFEYSSAVPDIIDNLDVTLASLTLARRSKIIAAIVSLNINIDDVVETDTIRRVMKKALSRLNMTIPEAEV